MSKPDDKDRTVLTEDMLREALSFGASFPQKHYYPIHPNMWDSFLKIGYTEEQLINYGFIKATYIAPESDIEL